MAAALRGMCTSVSALRRFPFRTVQEVCVIEILHLTEALGGFLALCDASELTKIFEALDAGRNHDQNLRATPAFGRERVRKPRRHDNNIALLGPDDRATREDSHHATEHIEHLSRTIVAVWPRAVGAP